MNDPQNPPRLKAPAADFGFTDLLLLLIFFLLFLGVQNSWSYFDPLNHQNTSGVMNGLRYFLLWQNEPLQISFLIAKYPPLVFLTSSLFYWTAGFSLPVAYLSTLGFALLLLPALFGLGRIFGDKILSWSLIFLVLANPRTLFWSKCYTQNFPEAAFVALTFYLLLKCRNFSHRGYSLGLGLALGLGLLSKYLFFYLAFPLLWSLVVLLAALPPKERLKNLLGLSLLLLLIAGGFYLTCRFEFYRNIDRHFLAFQIAALLLGLLPLCWQHFKKLSSPAANFWAALGTALGLALPWHFQAAEILRHQYQFHLLMSGIKGNLFNALKILVYYAATNFPGAWLFLPAGLVFLYLRRRDLNYQLLGWGLLGGFLLIAWFGVSSSYRYLLALLPFVMLTALGWSVLLPRKVRIFLLILSALWFGANLTSLTLAEAKSFPPGSEMARSARAPLEFTISRPFPAFLRPDLLEDLPDLGLNTPDITLSLTDLKALSDKIADTLGGFPAPGVKIVFLNLIPDCRVERSQIKTFLLARRFIPLYRLDYQGDAELVEIREFSGCLRSDELEDHERLIDFPQASLNPAFHLLMLAGRSGRALNLLEQKVRQKGLRPKFLARYRLSDYNLGTPGGELRLYQIKP